MITTLKIFILFIYFFLNLFSCDVENPQATLSPITNNISPLGAEVIINESDVLSTQEVAEVQKFCLQAQDLQLARFSSKLSYDFEYRKCATEDGVPRSVKFDVALAVLAAGQIIIVKQDGNSVPAFFRTHNSHTSGTLGFLCPGILNGTAKSSPRYRKISESEFEAIYVSQGSSCGQGVATNEYCFTVQNMISSGGQTYRVQSMTHTTWVSASESAIYAGVEKVRNYFTLATNCRVGDLYEIVTKYKKP